MLVGKYMSTVWTYLESTLLSTDTSSSEFRRQAFNKRTEGSSSAMGYCWTGKVWQQLLSAFHLYEKNGCSGGTTNGTVLPSRNFSEKRNSFRRIPLFPFLLLWLEYCWTICLITLVYHAPCGYMQFISQNYQWKEPFHLIQQWNNCFFHTHCSIWQEIVTSFSTWMESAA